MSMGVKVQVLTEIRASPLFSFQFDEPTDVSSCSQLLVFVSNINSGDIKDEFLFCNALETNIESDDLAEKFQMFSMRKVFNEKTCGGLYGRSTRQAGVKVKSRVKKLALQAKGIHSMMHRYAVTSKTLQVSLQKLLDSAIKMVNHVKLVAINTRLFKELCKDTNAEYEVFLFFFSGYRQ